MTWLRRCSIGSSSWDCLTILTSIRTRPSAWSAATNIAQLARERRRATITLLKNENNLAPLNLNKIQDHCRHRSERESQSARRLQWRAQKHDVSVLEGIKAKVGKRAKVLYSEGCKITIGGALERRRSHRQRSGRGSKANCQGRRSCAEGRRDRSRHRRQRTNFARSLEPESHGRSAEP